MKKRIERKNDLNKLRQHFVGKEKHLPRLVKRSASVVKTAGGLIMDNTTLKKKLSTYRSDKDRLSNLPADVLLEVLTAWEQWPGKLKDFYASIGVSHRQMAGIMGKAKKLRRDGHFPAEEFKEIKLDSVVDVPCSFL